MIMAMVSRMVILLRQGQNSHAGLRRGDIASMSGIVLAYGTALEGRLETMSRRLGLILAAAVVAGVIAGVALALTGFVTDGGVHLFACAVTVIVLSLLVQGPEDMPYHQGRM